MLKVLVKFCLLLGIVFESLAVPFTVDTTADTVDAVPGDSACADSGGACSLRAAIMETNALAGYDLIWVPPGNYNLSLTGVDEDAAASGDLDITDTVDISGTVGVDLSGEPLAPAAVIDAQGIDRVFHVLDGANDVGFSILVIRGGSASVASEPRGGGIYVDWTESTVGLSFSIIENNQAEAGGGIANFGEMFITAAIIEDNAIEDVGFINANGAAIFNSGTINMLAASVVNNVNNSVFGNVFTIRNGNAIRFMMSNVTVSSNSARGIDLQNTDARISSSTIADNQAEGIGHFSFDGTDQLTIENTIITGHPTNCSIDAGVNTFSFNLSSDDTCFGSGGGNQINTDPGLLPLSLTGLSPYRPLAEDSPAVDMASPAAPGGPSPACPLQDQLLFSRPADGDADGIARCDVGAVESDLIFKNGYET